MVSGNDGIASITDANRHGTAFDRESYRLCGADGTTRDDRPLDPCSHGAVASTESPRRRIVERDGRALVIVGWSRAPYETRSPRAGYSTALVLVREPDLAVAPVAERLLL